MKTITMNTAPSPQQIQLQKEINKLREELETVKSRFPTTTQIRNACLSYRHDYGLMSRDEQIIVELDALDWLTAFAACGIRISPP
jgi:hypothetical protein